jgi:hypothetical protein
MEARSRGLAFFGSRWLNGSRFGSIWFLPSGSPAWTVLLGILAAYVSDYMNKIVHYPTVDSEGKVRQEGGEAARG